MPFIDTIPADSADGAVHAMYQRQKQNGAEVPNYALVYCYRPALMQAWAAMQKELKANMDDKIYSLVSMAAALEGKGSYCAMAFARRLLRSYYTVAQVTAIVSDKPDSPLSRAEQGIVALARKVVQDASSVTQQDIDLLRGENVSDAAIFDVVAAASARCFFSKVADALGAQPDSTMSELDESLISVLSVGRAIEGKQ